MKTNHDSLASLARSAIDGDATDAQLEALESAIMESNDGADWFRDFAEFSFASNSAPASPAAPAAAISNSAAVRRRRRVWAVIAGVGALAGVIAIFAAAVLSVLILQGGAKKIPALLARSPGKGLVVKNGENAAEGGKPIPEDPAAAPEPATALLFLSGSMLLLLRRRRPAHAGMTP